MIASRMFRYGSLDKDPKSLDRLQGESFMAARRSPKTGDKSQVPLSREWILALETGKTFNTRGVMAVPILAGRPFVGPFENFPLRGWYKKLANNEYDIINTSSTEGLLVEELDNVRRSSGIHGVRTRIVGILKRRRTQRPLLRFYAEYDRIRPKHLAKYDRAFAMALTESGRAGLRRKNEIVRTGREAYANAFRRYLSSNPGNYSESRKVAQAAKRAAERRAIAPKGKVSA